MNDNLARKRIARLVDESSFMEIGSLITARNTDFNLNSVDTPSDGVITGHGLIDGRLVFVYSQDISVLNGTIGEMHSKKIATLYERAMKIGAPVIGMLDCGGVRLQESVDALHGLGEIYKKQAQASGLVPQITMVFGNCGGGLNIAAAMSDFVFVSQDKAKMYVNSPDAIAGNRTELCDISAPDYQSANTGVVDASESEDAIFADVRELVGFLPASCREDGLQTVCTDDLNRSCAGLKEGMGNAAFLISEIADDQCFFETKRAYAKEMTTGFIRINGTAVGVLANCTEVTDAEGNVTETFASVLTPKGCEKAAGFIRFCDAFDIPLLTMTNVTGYEATLDSEAQLAKAVANMVAAFAEADVPRVNVITGTAYGSAYTVMNSKALGADLVYAWPDTKIAAMDARLAAGILYDGENAAAQAEGAKAYEQLQASTRSAARRGYVDLIFEPAQTRKYVAAAFEMLYTKQQDMPGKKHRAK